MATEDDEIVDHSRVTTHDVADSRSGPIRPPNLQRRLPWTIGLALVALLFGGGGPRSSPGGLVSIIFDVLPFVAALVAIMNGLVCLRARLAAPKLIALIFILIATVALANVITDVYSFWIRPFASGDLFGF
jgi:hypothetical protein